MALNWISEEDLRAALNPYRVDSVGFETAVRQRMKEDARREFDPLSTMSPLMRSAASLLPLDIFATGQTAGTAVNAVPFVGTLSKLLACVAFPAISLFVLLGSTIFGAAKIRRIQSDTGSRPASAVMDERSLNESAKRWMRNHRVGEVLLFATMLALAWFGATWLMFLGYIVSTLVLLYILRGFARVGIGDRRVVGASCITGLILLGQLAGFSGIGDEDIHVLDQLLLAPLFFAGVLGVTLVTNWGNWKRAKIASTGILAAFTLLAAVWVMRPILWPATPARINAYVESFDRAEFSSASWRQWEIVASWAVKSNPPPNLSRPRQLLAKEIFDQSDTLPEILDSAFKVGLVRVDQVRQLKDYDRQLHTLFELPPSSRISLGWDDWVIRAAALRNDLTPEQRDYLAERLHATLRLSLTRNTPRTLDAPLRATQLLAAIGRPVDPGLYRADVQALLKRLHSTTGGGFRRAGFFREFDTEEIRAGDLEATSDAIELMEIYGIPKDLDMNWVRSALRPSAFVVDEKWIAAVTLDRMNHLPGITHPSWYEILYYERSFLAAMVLIGLCIYATAISPRGSGISNRI